MFSGPWEILLILAIALLLFGSKKIRTLGSDLGAGLKGFKKSMKAVSYTHLRAHETR